MYQSLKVEFDLKSHFFLSLFLSLLKFSSSFPCNLDKMLMVGLQSEKTPGYLKSMIAKAFICWMMELNSKPPRYPRQPVLLI